MGYEPTLLSLKIFGSFFQFSKEVGGPDFLVFQNMVTLCETYFLFSFEYTF